MFNAIFQANHLIGIMTLLGVLPPPLWHPPVAIEPYFLYAIVEKIPVQVIAGHCKPPRPKGDTGWQTGGDHHVKRGFSLE